jgi:hypothetical protein
MGIQQVMPASSPPGKPRLDHVLLGVLLFVSAGYFAMPAVPAGSMRPGNS